MHFLLPLELSPVPPLGITQIDLKIKTKFLLRTFWRHAGIPGIVPLLGGLVADGSAALGPPQNAERPVQSPEGAAPH